MFESLGKSPPPSASRHGRPGVPRTGATRPTPARSAVTGAQPTQPTDEGDSGALPWPPSLIRDLLVSALFKTMRLLMVLPVNAAFTALTDTPQQRPTEHEQRVPQPALLRDGPRTDRRPRSSQTRRSPETLGLVT